MRLHLFQGCNTVIHSYKPTLTYVSLRYTHWRAYSQFPRSISSDRWLVGARRIYPHVDLLRHLLRRGAAQGRPKWLAGGSSWRVVAGSSCCSTKQLDGYNFGSPTGKKLVYFQYLCWTLYRVHFFVAVVVWQNQPVAKHQTEGRSSKTAFGERYKTWIDN